MNRDYSMARPNQGFGAQRKDITQLDCTRAQKYTEEQELQMTEAAPEEPKRPQDELPYERRMLNIIKGYRQLLKWNDRLACYAKQLENEIEELKETNAKDRASNIIMLKRKIEKLEQSKERSGFIKSRLYLEKMDLRRENKRIKAQIKLLEKKQKKKEVTGNVLLCKRNEQHYLMDDVELTPLISDFLTQNQVTRLAAEELCQALNDIIGHHNLQPPAVISLLARLSAGYIHLAQKAYNQKCPDEVVEEDFYNFLVATLTSLEIGDVGNEIEEMKNSELN